MGSQHEYIDLSGVPRTSSSPDHSTYRDDPSATQAWGEGTSQQQQQPPPRRSSTGSPRHSVSYGQSGENSARMSYEKRRSSAGYSGAAAVPGGVPLRRRDSIKHPYSLQATQATEPTPEDSLMASTNNNNNNNVETGNAAKPSTEDYIYRASAHSRRHSASVAVLNRGVSDSAEPVNTTVSASPERPNTAGAPAATTQEDVKRYIYTTLRDHAATLGTWEQRVTVAEVYRDRPLRTGGRPAPIREQDRNFLERVVVSVKAHRRQLDDARSLLQETRREVPRSTAGGHGDLDAWDEYCSCYEQTLMDLIAEAKQMHKRVDKLLKGEEREAARTHRTRAGSTPQSNSARTSRARSQGSIASRRGSPQATPRGPRPGAASERQDTHEAPAQHHQQQQQTADASPLGDNSHHPHHNTNGAAGDRNPYVPHLGGGAVQRGSQAIRPGNGSESAMRASPAPESQPSWTRASSLQHPPRASVASAHSHMTTRSQQQARSLHPDTVVRQSVPTGSPSDMQSPYGRLLSPKRASSTLRDPTHAVLVVPPPADVAAEMREEAEAPATARSSRASRGSRTSRAVSSSRPANDVPPQLRTYSSPRGSARASAAAPASATPSVHPLRRRQLLEVIEHYEKNSATLQRGDLHRARGCFYELYGEQQGLHQYCLWIDDIALSALHVPQ